MVSLSQKDEDLGKRRRKGEIKEGKKEGRKGGREGGREGGKGDVLSGGP